MADVARKPERRRLDLRRRPASASARSAGRPMNSTSTPRPVRRRATAPRSSCGSGRAGSPWRKAGANRRRSRCQSPRNRSAATDGAVVRAGTVVVAAGRRWAGPRRRSPAGRQGSVRRVSEGLSCPPPIVRCAENPCRPAGDAGRRYRHRQCRPRRQHRSPSAVSAISQVSPQRADRSGVSSP